MAGNDGAVTDAVPEGITISAPVDDPFYARARLSGPVVALRVRGKRREIAVPAEGRRWVVGSRAGCDIVIDDPYVSGMHCVLERAGDALVVRDRRSKNGTYVNGHAVEGAELRPGSVLVIGKTELMALAEGGRGVPSAYEKLCGSDPRFRAAVETAIRAAAADCGILVVGETGTGKELVARAIHEASTRAWGPFVAVNCGGIPRELIGSELFGHARGAFTGATTDREGVFEQAAGGTLFLDELGELPLEQQPHLLRALETRRVRRVGGTDERAVDVRIVAATNRIEGLGTPRSAIRLDLYHRIATVVVTLPPLRARMGDLDELVDVMLDEIAPQHGRRRLSDVAREALHGYDWPGNVRELRHTLLRAAALGGTDIRLEDLFPAQGILPPRPGRVRGTPAPDIQGLVQEGVPLPPYEAVMRELMVDALARCPSIRTAAQYLGMPKSTFAEKAARWGLLEGRKRRR